MTLQELVALAEIVSAFAVVLTLIVLIISIRQNTKSQKALVVDSLAAAITSINVPAMGANGSPMPVATSVRQWLRPHFARGCCAFGTFCVDIERFSLSNRCEWPPNHERARQS